MDSCQPWFDGEPLRSLSILARQREVPFVAGNDGKPRLHTPHLDQTKSSEQTDQGLCNKSLVDADPPALPNAVFRHFPPRGWSFSAKPSLAQRDRPAVADLDEAAGFLSPSERLPSRLTARGPARDQANASARRPWFMAWGSPASSVLELRAVSGKLNPGGTLCLAGLRPGGRSGRAGLRPGGRSGLAGASAWLSRACRDIRRVERQSEPDGARLDGEPGSAGGPGAPGDPGIAPGSPGEGKRRRGGATRGTLPRTFRTRGPG